MPVYEYACTSCGSRLEVRQSFTDDALTTCPECSGRLRKLLSPVGVVFKGSGFYRTDSRSAPADGSATTANTGGGDSGAGKSSDGSGASTTGAGGDSAAAKKAAPAKKGGEASSASSGSSAGSGGGNSSAGTKAAR